MIIKSLHFLLRSKPKIVSKYKNNNIKSCDLMYVLFCMTHFAIHMGVYFHTKILRTSLVIAILDEIMFMKPFVKL